MTNDYVNQRVPVSKKLNSDWYIPNMKYWVAYAKNNKSQQETINNINAANGIVDADTYKYVLDPLSAQGVENKPLPVVIRDVDFITPIREKNIGEFIQLPDNYTVKVNDPDIVIKLRESINSEVSTILQQMFINDMNKVAETGVPSKEMQDPAEMIKSIKRSVFDKRAINASKLIGYLNDKNDLNNKRTNLFIDWWSTEEFYIRLYSKNGEVVYDRINPINAFPIINDNQYVHEYDGFLIENTITIHKIKEFYDDELSAKDKKYLDQQILLIEGGKGTINSTIIMDIYGRKLLDSNSKSIGANVELDIPGTTMYERILYFKTLVPSYIVYRFNELGEVTAELVDSDYELDDTLGDFEIKKEWIYETWEQICLGNLDATGIYLPPKPVQAQIYDDYGQVHIPIYGKYGIASNIAINPIPKRIIPNLALYRIITLHIERQLAKFKGEVEIIPKSMLVGEGKDTDAKAAMWHRLADNTLIVDDTNISPAVMQSYRIVGNSALGNYIAQLIQLKENIKAEAWDMANMNDGRYGNAPASSTVTNNKDNIYRAKLGSVLMISIFNNTLMKLYEGMVELAKVVYPKGVANSYFDKSGNVIHFNIDGGELTGDKYGVFATNSIKEDEKLQQFKDLGFAASQNGEFELAIKTINADTTSEIGNYISEFTKLNKEFQEKQQIQASESAQAAQQAAYKQEQDLITLKETLAKERELAVANVQASKQK